MRTVRRVCHAIFLVAIVVSSVRAQDNPYHEDGWAKFPDGRRWGWASAIDIDKRGNIWVFERCGANSCAGSKVAPVVQLTPWGRPLRTFGAGMFAWPHGIHVDRAGAIWVVDGEAKEGKGNVVVKFSPEGKVLLRLGKPGVSGDGPDVFNRPSDVVTAPNGDIFVADGHGGDSNARIVKFSKDGTFIKAWGRKGTGQGEFDTPHALAMDSQGRLFVGDRGNSRIQIFDQDGKFLEEWRQFGRPSGIYIDKKDMIYVADHQSGKALNPGFKRGIRIGSVRDGKVLALIPGLGADPESQSVGEGVVSDGNGSVWWAETSGMNVRKFVLK
jgi:hypothetical protein